MTARDRWIRKLSCESCETNGEARVSQNDGWAFKNDPSTQVDSIIGKFKSEQNGMGVKFLCSVCGKEV